MLVKVASGKRDQVFPLMHDIVFYWTLYCWTDETFKKEGEGYKGGRGSESKQEKKRERVRKDQDRWGHKEGTKAEGGCV